MNAAAFPEYMPYAADQACVRNRDDAGIPSAAPAARRATNDVHSRTSLVQRTIVWIKDWVKSRVAAVRMRWALAPFVQSVSKEGAAGPTSVHFEELASALEFVFSIEHGAQGVVRRAVSHSLAKMDRGEQATLRSVLGIFKPVDNVLTFSQCAWESLYPAVNDTLAQSIRRDAQFHLLNALEQISDLSTSDGSTRFKELDFACAHLAEHLKIVTPDNASSDASQQPLSPEKQMACIPTSTDYAVRDWFSKKDATIQNKILFTVRMLASNSCVLGPRDALKRARLAAFCKHVKVVLANATRTQRMAPQRDGLATGANASASAGKAA
jgi:hypothetical protein